MSRLPWLTMFLLWFVVGPVWSSHGAAANYANAGYSELKVSSGGKAGFQKLLSSETGILFSNVLSTNAAAENQVRLNGSGVAAGDVDGDGWCDLYFCGLESSNRLYRNIGNWRFQD